VALLAVAAFAIRMLYYRTGPGSGLEPGALEVLLAAMGFFASSAGAAVLLLGAHIFDQVRISERWAYRDLIQPRSKRRADGSSTAMAGTDGHVRPRHSVPDHPGSAEAGPRAVDRGSPDFQRCKVAGPLSPGSVNRDRQGWSATAFSELPDS
jgi:hypothetical protein